MVRARVSLSDLDPVTRERIAVWLESKVVRLSQTITKSLQLIASGNAPDGLAKQVEQWRGQIAAARKWAWDVRVERKAKFPTPPNTG